MSGGKRRHGSLVVGERPSTPAPTTASSDLLACFPFERHWPIDLIHLHSQIRRPVNLHGTSTASTTPLRLILHLTPPPSNVKDKLILSSTTDALKSQYMTSLKEADFVRWGHTRRITGLKRMDLEGGWRGIVEG
jgi:autophagy-related protein 5